MKTENEIIAEFMGWKWHGEPFNDWLVNGMLLGKHLQFDTSWDWLMPAWVKFRDINPTGFLQELSEHDDWKHIIGSAILYDDIKTACEKLVEGIKWYNENKSKP